MRPPHPNCFQQHFHIYDFVISQTVNHPLSNKAEPCLTRALSHMTPYHSNSCHLEVCIVRIHCPEPCWETSVSKLVFSWNDVLLSVKFSIEIMLPLFLRVWEGYLPNHFSDKKSQHLPNILRLKFICNKEASFNSQYLFKNRKYGWLSNKN